MAKDGQGTPIVDQAGGVKSKAQRLVERMAQVDAAAGSQPGSARAPVEHHPFTHSADVPIIRPAGQMVMGSRAPVPAAMPVVAGPDGGVGTQLFSSARDGRSRGVSGGAAVALACAVAVGSTAALTTALNQAVDTDNGPARLGQAKPGTGRSADIIPSQAAMAPSLSQPQATQVASLSPIAIPQVASADQKLIRVAKKDATGFIVENVTGVSGSQLPVRVAVTQENPDEYSFLMFRGLPAEVSLSAGFRLKDSWAVSLRDLENLALVSPPDFEGSFEVEVLLIKGRNTPADSRVIIVDLQSGPVAAPAPAPVASTPPQQQEQPSPRLLTAAPPAPSSEPKAVYESAPARQIAVAPARPKMGISSEMETSMLEKATSMLSNGDVSSARLLFEHLAKKGSGKAAMALARTYDPSFFNSIDTMGLRPNPEKAKEWYAVAAELGQDEARGRLGALTGAR